MHYFLRRIFNINVSITETKIERVIGKKKVKLSLLIIIFPGSLLIIGILPNKITKIPVIIRKIPIITKGDSIFIVYHLKLIFLLIQYHCYVHGLYRKVVYFLKLV